VTGGVLLDGYGMTETGNIALATPQRPTGCGPPLPGVDVRIVSSGGRRLPPGAAGGISVRTPGRMEGYLRVDGTVATPREWLDTGDLGHLDPHGNLHVHGRRNAVHRLGMTIYPEELERRAEAHGAAVKVIALDDERRGCALVFFVRDTRHDARTWRHRFRELLQPFERPSDVVVLAEFPVGETGKVDTAALRRHAARRQRQARR
jgi:acyl-coenzyme A synthetase/AMP-(fatty) acid ligase